MALAVTYGSLNAKSGFQVITGSVQFALPCPTTPATIVDATGFDTDATWKTVAGSIVSGSPTLRTP